MTRLETAHGVATQLFAAENAIDDAIREAARLTLVVIEARADLNLAAVVGGDVFDRAAALHGALAASRGEAVAMHEALAGVRDQLRISMSLGLDKPTRGAAAPEIAAGDAAPAQARRLRSI